MSIYVSEDPEVVSAQEDAVRAASTPELVAGLREDCYAEVVCDWCQEEYVARGKFAYGYIDNFVDFEEVIFYPHLGAECPDCGCEDFRYIRYGLRTGREMEA